MPDEDRKDLFLWILIFRFGNQLPRLRGHDHHEVAHRYIHELKIRGVVEPMFCRNIGNGTYREVDDAMHSLTANGWLEHDDSSGRSTLRISERSKFILLTDQKDLTPDELRIAQEAAEVTYKAYPRNLTVPEPEPAP